MGEAHALARRQVAGVMAVRAAQPRLRIGMPGQVVVDQRHRHQERRIEQHGPDQHETEVMQLRTADRRHQRQRDARRVQAAQVEQAQQRQARRQRQRSHARQPAHTQTDADQRGQQIAGKHRPGLGERAGRGDEYQHRRGAGRAHDLQGQRTADQQIAAAEHQRHDDGDAEGGAQPLLRRGIQRGGDERANPEGKRVVHWSCLCRNRERPPAGGGAVRPWTGFERDRCSGVQPASSGEACGARSSRRRRTVSQVFNAISSMPLAKMPPPAMRTT